MPISIWLTAVKIGIFVHVVKPVINRWWSKSMLDLLGLPHHCILNYVEKDGDYNQRSLLVIQKWWIYPKVLLKKWGFLDKCFLYNLQDVNHLLTRI